MAHPWDHQHPLVQLKMHDSVVGVDVVVAAVVVDVPACATAGQWASWAPRDLDSPADSVAAAMAATVHCRLDLLGGVGAGEIASPVRRAAPA